jgi:hypothetical protein
MVVHGVVRGYEVFPRVILSCTVACNRLRDRSLRILYIGVVPRVVTMAWVHAVGFVAGKDGY